MSEMSPRDAITAWDMTPAGMLYSAFRLPREASRDQVEQRLEATRRTYRDRFRRELTETEVQSVRAAAECRNLPVFASPEPISTAALVELVNSRNLDAQWACLPSRRQGSGLAVFQEWDGQSVGDPVIAEGTRAAMAQREQQAAAHEAAWMAHPATRGVGRPTT